MSGSTNSNASTAAAPPLNEKTEYLVSSLEGVEDPQQLPLLRRWIAVLTISGGAMCVTCASSMAAFTQTPMMAEFHVSKIVTILGISLFVEGLGIGPLLVGPLSEVYGRNSIYRISYFLFLVFSFPVAFAPNIAVYLVFRFMTGLCGAAFLSVAGGSISDMFPNSTVANPMAVYTMSPFLGPVLGPLLAGFINENLQWRWTYWILIIWVFVQWVSLLIFVPETYVPVLLKRKAIKLRKSTGDPGYYAAIERRETSLVQAIVKSCYTPFELMLVDRMALLLNIWTALILGILYLTFQAFPLIFQQGHGFTLGQTGMSFLGIGVGMVMGGATQPYWNRLFAKESAKYNGNPPPEIRLKMGQVGGILIPIGLFWLAFTTYPSVHWVVPILASVPFGAGLFFVFTSVFTYLVTAYRPIAASAMASNSALRSIFAAVFPLFAGPMYAKLGTVGATALLAGLMTIMAPLPFIFYKMGPRLRAKSRFAVTD